MAEQVLKATTQAFLDRQKKRALGSVLLTLVPSTNSATPDVKHEIRIGSDNLIYCTCKGWQFHRAEDDHQRMCKHILNFKKELQR